MQIKSRMVPILVMLCLAWGFLATPEIAAEGGSTDVVLPRTFQDTQLGMTLSKFSAIVPAAKPVLFGEHDQAERTMTAPSKDRFLQHIEYRFFNDRLREFTIHYNGDVAGGYAGLLKKLHESYGKPHRQNLQEYHTQPEAFSRKTTVWKDHATMVRLIETRKMNGDKRELILTITDLTHQPTTGQGQAHRAQELSIPIPLPDHRISNEQATVPDRAGAQTSHARG